MENSPHGRTELITNDEKRRELLELAFDYRGDVTLTFVDGSQLTGYLCNRDTAVSPPLASLLVIGTDEPRVVAWDQVTQVAFTGKDPAAGHTWESWMAYRARAEAEGKIAELYPETE